MLRRTGFKRPTLTRIPREERVTKWPSALAIPARAAIQTIATMEQAQPKENVAHSSTYEVRVRKLACRRCGIVGFSQFCHMDMGKGTGIKTDVRQGWAGCGPHQEKGVTVPGCHWFVGTSGTLPREEKRALEDEYAASTRAEILKNGEWPKKLHFYPSNQPPDQ